MCIVRWKAIPRIWWMPLRPLKGFSTIGLFAQSARKGFHGSLSTVSTKKWHPHKPSNIRCKKQMIVKWIKVHLLMNVWPCIGLFKWGHLNVHKLNPTDHLPELCGSSSCRPQKGLQQLAPDHSVLIPGTEPVAWSTTNTTAEVLMQRFDLYVAMKSGSNNNTNR